MNTTWLNTAGELCAHPGVTPASLSTIMWPARTLYEEHKNTQLSRHAPLSAPDSEGLGPRHRWRLRGLTTWVDLQDVIPNDQTMRYNRWWVETRCRSERLLFRGSLPIDHHRVASVQFGMLRTPVSLMSIVTVSLRLVTVAAWLAGGDLSSLWP